MTSDAETKFNEILAHFEVAKRRGTSAQARCPAHNDKNPSLTISLGERGIICKCHAGCSFEDIAMAAGLKPNDFFFDNKPLPKKERWQSYVEKKKGKQIEAVYHYKRLDGSYAFTRIRFVGKDFCYGILKGDFFRFGLGKKSRKSIPAIFAPAGLNAPKIFFCEGEKDVLTLQKHELHGFTCGGAGDWTKEISSVTKDKELVIFCDNDSPGKQLAEEVKRDCEGIAKSVRIVTPSTKEHGDISDYFAEGGTVEQLSNLPETPLNIESVRVMLEYLNIFDNEGKIKGKKLLQSVRNHVIVLQNDSRLKGRLKFNEFTKQTCCVENGTVREWDDSDDARTFSVLQSDYGLTSRQDFLDATKIIERENRFNPLVDRLHTLATSYTGEIIADNLLPWFLGAEPTPYNIAVFRRWMLGAVARAMNPGCKFEIVPILVGPQGSYKSTFCRMLALNDLWFMDALGNLDDPRTAEALIGNWITEIGEIRALNKSDPEASKRFLSANCDRLRLPYAKRSVTYPRTTAFIGTTNQIQFLHDTSGNRRFFPVEVAKTEPTKSLFDADAQEIIEQAWGEIVTEYLQCNGAVDLLIPAELQDAVTEAQEAATSDNGMEGQILQFAEDETAVCVIQLWQEALQEKSRPTRQQANEIVDILIRNGWQRATNPRVFKGYGRQKWFSPPVPFKC